MNLVVLSGRLCKEWNLRYLQSGTAVGSNSLAVSKKYKDANGQTQEKTLFIDFQVWGKMAEVANQYTQKGSKVLISGELELQIWQDNNGTGQRKHAIVVSTFEFLDGVKSQNNGGNNGNFNANNYQNSGSFNQEPQNKPLNFGNGGKYEAPKFPQNENGEFLPF